MSTSDDRFWTTPCPVAECVDRLLAASSPALRRILRAGTPLGTVMARRQRGSVLLWRNDDAGIPAEDYLLRLELTFYETEAGAIVQGRPRSSLFSRSSLLELLVFGVGAATALPILQATLGQYLLAGALAVALVLVIYARNRKWDRESLGVLSRHLEEVLEARPMEADHVPPDRVEVIELGDAVAASPR